MKKRFKSWIVIICICILASLMIVIVEGSVYTGDKAREELLALDANLTISDLKTKGYIDVSQTMDSSDDKIEFFLRKAKERKRGVLRITTILDGKLCAKILIYDKQLDAIRMWTGFPNQKQMEDPGKCFSTETYETTNEDVKTVFLKNISGVEYNAAQTEFIDEKLYSYWEESSKKM